jgi:hypothetical protein
MQQLKSASEVAWTPVIAAELFDQLDIATNEPLPAFDMGFRGE